MHFTPYFLLAATALAAPLAVDFDDDTCEQDFGEDEAVATPEPTQLPSSAISSPMKAVVFSTPSLAENSQTTPAVTVPTSTLDATATPAADSSSSASAAPSSSAAAQPTTPANTQPSKYTRMIAFGDNLSDNGNGSYAHGATDPSGANPKVYGYGTWTNGPVAVSYLSSLLNVPLEKDYAYGHADGGSKFGATIDNAYTQSPANAPSSKDQIAEYTGSSPSAVDETLHFLWIGANDINLYHLDVSTDSDPGFGQEFSGRLSAQVKSLLDAGATQILVPNLYAKHISRSSEFYADTPEKVANLGAIIKEANDAIDAELAQYGEKVLVYDVYGFMLEVWENHGQYGIEYVGKHQIDTSTQEDWDLYFVDHEGDEFYWMQFLDMTTHVHRLIAEDMQKAVVAHFG